MVGLAATTPGRLSVITAGLVALTMAAGAASVLALQDKTATLDELSMRSAPLRIAAQQVYRSLSDADATAASAFLSGGTEPAPARARYLDDIAQAEAALSTATEQSGAATSREDSLLRLATQLPVYSGLVETARTYNRQGLPVGAAYLREASGLMRAELLPAAERLYTAQTVQVISGQDRAASFPVIAGLLGLLALVALLATQRYLSRRTNRTFNIGLVLATCAAFASLAWLINTELNVAQHVHASSRDGSAQIDVLAQARIATLEARGDETLTLVARGNGQGYQQDFKDKITRLAGSDGSGGLLGQARSLATSPSVRTTVDSSVAQATAWKAAHDHVRELDDTGQYNEAVNAATGADAASAATVFGQLDGSLARAIDQTTAGFDQEVDKARGRLSGVVAAVVALTLAMAAGSAVGLWQRLREYL
jgi:hypothetical protein